MEMNILLKFGLTTILFTFCMQFGIGETAIIEQSTEITSEETTVTVSTAVQSETEPSNFTTDATTRETLQPPTVKQNETTASRKIVTTAVQTSSVMVQTTIKTTQNPVPNKQTENKKGEKTDNKKGEQTDNKQEEQTNEENDKKTQDEDTSQDIDDTDKVMPKNKDSKPSVSDSKSLLNDEDSGGHFIAYFITFVVVCIAGYIIYHNKQKILAFILEGRKEGGTRRRPSSKEYKRLQTDEVMPSLEKSAPSDKYIY